MKKIFLIFALLFGILSFSQNLEKIAKEITDEGVEMYRSEMASWYGTDVFLGNYKDRDKIGGYFSYIDDVVPKCIFFSKENKVIGTIAFPTNYNPKNSKLDLNERDFTDTEKEYFNIRQKAYLKIKNDTIFKFYKNVNFNIVPIIKDSKKKVYVLSGTTLDNVVLFGNDYLIDFDSNNEISKVQRLHKSLLEFKINDEKIGKTISGIHSHILKDWQYMTPTDICTLMLYQHLTNWESYTTISNKYTSIWNCKSNNLIILKTEAYKKILDDQKLRHPENFKDEGK